MTSRRHRHKKTSGPPKVTPTSGENNAGASSTLDASNASHVADTQQNHSSQSPENGAHSPSSVYSVECPCVKCHQEVVNKAVKCDKCKRYTHLACDGEMNEEIYGIIDKYPNNPLIYLCALCRPKFAGDVNHERYIDTAMSKLDRALKESHSGIEFQIDLLVNAVTSRMGSLENQTREVGNNMSDLNNRVHELCEKITRPTMSHVQKSTHTQGAQTDQAEYNHPHQSQSDRPLPQSENPPTQQTRNHRNTALYPLLAPSAQYPMPQPQNQFTDRPTFANSTPPNIRFMRDRLGGTNHTNFQNTQTPQEMPPNIQYMRETIQNNSLPPQFGSYPPPGNSGYPPQIHTSWAEQASWPPLPGREPPRQNQAQSAMSNYRGPPLFQQRRSDDNPPDPSVSLVVFGIDMLARADQTISDFANQCEVPLSCIQTIRRLPSSRARPPILVTCSDIGSKWRLLRFINTVDNVYAKPYLTEENRRKDRVLVSHLRDLRQRNPSEVFKIYRGEIYQEIDEHLVQLRQYSNVHSHF